MQDAVHRGVSHAAHYVPATGIRSRKTASLFGTGPCFGWSSQEVLVGSTTAAVSSCSGVDGQPWSLTSFPSSTARCLLSPLAGSRSRFMDGQPDERTKSTGPLALLPMSFLEMGMSVVQLPGGEIQPAMKSGLIDAAEFNNPTSDRDFGMQDVSKHYHLASFHQSQEFLRSPSTEEVWNRCPRNCRRFSNMPRRRKTPTSTGTHQAVLRRPHYASRRAGRQCLQDA